MRVQRIAENYPLGLALAMIFMFLPLLNWIGLSWAVLMTLRRNIYIGAATLALVGLVCVFVVHGLQFHISSLMDWASILFVVGPLWVMAYSLKFWRSLRWSLELGTVAVLMLTLMSYWVYGPLSYDVLYFYFSGGETAMPDFQRRYLEIVVTTLLIAWPSMLLMMQVMALLFARYIQSRWYNPNGFQPEFHALRLGRWVSVLLILSFGWAALTMSQLSIQVAGLIATLMSIAGLAWVHWWIKFRQFNTLWLVVIYVLLFMLSAWALLLLVVVAVADSYLDLRVRLQRSTR